MALLFLLLPFLQTASIGIRKVWVKKYIEQNVVKDEAKKIIIPIALYKHLHVGDEIEFNNSRFDILSAEKQGNCWIIYAIDDKLEHKLLSIFANKKGEHPYAKGLSLSNCDWIVEGNVTTLQVNPMITNFIRVHSLNLNECFVSLLHPPPEAFLSIRIKHSA